MSLLRRFAAAVFGGVVGAALATGVSATAGDDAYYRKPSIDNPMQLAGCVIRFDQLSPSGRSVVPRTHANVSHYNVGCPNVRVDDSDDGTGKVGDLIIYQSGTNRVVTAGVFVDETLAARDIYCGISGGGTSSRIRCFQDGKFVPVTDKAAFYSKTANLWLLWVRWEESAP